MGFCVCLVVESTTCCPSSVDLGPTKTPPFFVPQRGYTPLHSGARAKKVEAIAKLIEKNADVDANDKVR